MKKKTINNNKKMKKKNDKNQTFGKRKKIIRNEIDYYNAHDDTKSTKKL